MAIRHAHRIIDWQENLLEGEMPPEWMWPYEDELETWFEEVERARKARYGGGEAAEEADGDVLHNDLAKGRR